MTPDYIHTLYAYNRWANHRILESVSTLDEEPFTRDLGNSFPSVRDTLVHILSAEWIWLSRWQGDSPTRFPFDLENVASIRERWSLVEQDAATFIEALDEDRLNAVLSYKNTVGTPYVQPLWQQMCHVVNHSSYHRGQITTMLRQVGAAPVGTDMIHFFRE